jgi:hypothetical protein
VHNSVRFEVLTSVTAKITVLWCVTPFSLVYYTLKMEAVYISKILLMYFTDFIFHVIFMPMQKVSFKVFTGMTVYIMFFMVMSSVFCGGRYLPMFRRNMLPPSSWSIILLTY